MKEFNLIITSYRYEQNQLLKSLNEFEGEFKKTEFKDVLIGNVPDIISFLKQIKDKTPNSLARIIPLKEVFDFKPSILIELLKDKAMKYLPEIKGSFCVRCERRGFKHEINSKEIETEIGGLIHDELKNPKVDLEEPDTTLVIEILGNKAGIAILTEEIMNEYEFIHL